MRSTAFGKPIPEASGITPDRFHRDCLPAARPLVFRGLVADWPAVRAVDLLDYLGSFDVGASCKMLEAETSTGGRFFYDEAITGFNFGRRTLPLVEALHLVRVAGQAGGPVRAVQALRVAEALPGFSASNPAPLIEEGSTPNLWIGNASIVAAHQDQWRNLALVVAGRRRFTLFPPDQARNLYLGPLEFSPAGTPISMVDGRAPDLDRFPRFVDAMAAAQTAELAPGDAIYIPFMWWHQVESLDPVGMLANYWWREGAAPQPGLSGSDVLLHARLAFSAMTAEQRAAWRSLFDHVVFDEEGVPDHLPRDRRGMRGEIGEQARARVRRQLGALMQR